MSWQMRLLAGFLRLTRHSRYATAENAAAYLAEPKRPAAPTARVRDRLTTREVGGFPVHTVAPATPAGPGAVVYLHGGGYVGAIAPQHWDLIGDIADAAGRPVHVPRYGLAPEHTALEALALLRALLAELPGPVHLAGDSAGGGLALATALDHLVPPATPARPEPPAEPHAADSATPFAASAARPEPSAEARAADSGASAARPEPSAEARAADSAEPLAAPRTGGAARPPAPGARIVGLTLVAPWLDIALTNPEIPALERRDPWLSAAGLLVCGRAWSGGLPPDDPRVSPLFGDLTVLPPIDLYVGDRDIAVADCRLLRDRAPAVTLHEEPGAVHDYPLLPLAPESRAARATLLAGIRAAFDRVA